VTAAEFFAGIGLVRVALDRAGIAVRWANDIEPVKRMLYAANFGADDFVLSDVRAVRGSELPAVDLATASFPCTDLSLAGNRAGLSGTESSMFWEFARVLAEMPTRPSAVLLENVPGFATSHGGRDLYQAVRRLNELGYWCDIFVVDAQRFVAQSRLRMFVVGTERQLAPRSGSTSDTRPAWVAQFAARYPRLKLQAFPLPDPPAGPRDLNAFLERLPSGDSRWWSGERAERFARSLSPGQAARLQEISGSRKLQWRTAYRRTRGGVAVWEIRKDGIAGCLRTARGGSSKQAVVQAGRGQWRVRWMTAREYARLQGAPEFRIDPVTESQAMYGFGDAVCVPAIEWIAVNYLRPALDALSRERTEASREAV
jgi:DNA (cytosine-5)-methyltransferase 1